MFLEIFDVEHGQCAHLMSDFGTQVLIDCGHNTSTGWRPSTYLSQLGIRKLDKLIITNYDEDHASDLANLRAQVAIESMFGNPSVNADALINLKNIGGIGNGIKALSEMKRAYVGAVPPSQDTALNFQYFWNNYPSDFDDENNLSMVTVIDFSGVRFCFPGDIETAGWESLLRAPAFVSAISTVNILVASHHGRENGCSELLYAQTGLHPQLTIVSDSGIQHSTQETVQWYANRTSGITIDGTLRRVLTTRSDGRIRFANNGNGWTVARHAH